MVKYTHIIFDHQASTIRQGVLRYQTVLQGRCGEVPFEQIKPSTIRYGLLHPMAANLDATLNPVNWSQTSLPNESG